MKLFPTTELKFIVTDSQNKTLSRLNRRTEHSEYLTSQYTDKSFRGKVYESGFEVISSAIGYGAFCVMKGQFSSDSGKVTVEIHKVFKILLSIILLFPVIALSINLINEPKDFSPVFIVVVVFQILFIRFVFIGLAFRYTAKSSLKRLQDVMDIEWK